jgi:hypothetical protein
MTRPTSLRPQILENSPDSPPASPVPEIEKSAWIGCTIKVPLGRELAQITGQVRPRDQAKRPGAHPVVKGSAEDFLVSKDIQLNNYQCEVTTLRSV